MRRGISCGITLTAAVLSIAVTLSCGPESKPPLGVLGIEGEDRLGSNEAQGERNFARLMEFHAQGAPLRQPWAGFWWPFTSNGIAKGLSGGSPAGKYDAARGGLTNAQGWEARHHGADLPGIQGWWGHCNGWCVASALFREPRESVEVNGIQFTVADIKALLSEVGMEASADYFGDRVDFFDRYAPQKWVDTVPNQYFLVLTNYMGIHGRVVLIDRYTGGQVWNQPIAGYRFQMPKPEDYLGADPSAPNVFKIRVTSTIWWMEDNVPPGALSPEFNFEANSMVSSRNLKMELWLDGPVFFDSSGKLVSSGDVIVAREGEFIVGGKWSHGNISNGHPDYMWVPYSVLKPDPRAEEKHANAYIDIDWIRRHILSGGVDDPSVRPAPIRPAPVPRPTATPTSLPTSSPRPTPSSTPSSGEGEG